jgi:hypothetical protein
MKSIKVDAECDLTPLPAAPVLMLYYCWNFGGIVKSHSLYSRRHRRTSIWSCGGVRAAEKHDANCFA